MSRPSSTDLELVRGLHARDPKTLASVYGVYHAAIYNLCARILGDREEAKDVTQDVFVTAFSKPPEMTEDVRLRPWLFRVATNACFNLIRRRRSGDPVATEELVARGDPYEQAQTAALIETCLAGMNERYRAALVLKDMHGLQSAELADVLEVSRPAADVLVHRARASFRRAFAGLAGEDAVAPANLALALPLLPVPAALAALPLPLHAAPPAIGSGAGPAVASGAGPAAGLLTKIGAALNTKAAVVAASAAVLSGGGVVAVELAGDDHTVSPASAGGVPTAVHHGAGAGGSDHTRDDGRREHRHAIAARIAAHHAAESGRHAAGAHDAGPETRHAGDSGQTSAATQDAAAHDSTTSTAPDASSTATGAHGSGDAGHEESDGH